MPAASARRPPASLPKARRCLPRLRVGRRFAATQSPRIERACARPFRLWLGAFSFLARPPPAAALGACRFRTADVPCTLRAAVTRTGTAWMRVEGPGANTPQRTPPHTHTHTHPHAHTRTHAPVAAAPRGTAAAAAALVRRGLQDSARWPRDRFMRRRLRGASVFRATTKRALAHRPRPGRQGPRRPQLRLSQISAPPKPSSRIPANRP